MSPEPSNLFLDSLSHEERKLLLSHCKAIELPVRTILYEEQETPRYAYFITSGMASIVTSMVDGSTVEVGIIGHEGVVGSLHLLGPARFTTRCFMQLPGAGLSIPFAEMQKLFNTDEPIRNRVLEFAQEQALVMGQTVACSRLHEAEERLARWLLMVQDVTQSDVLNLTQEFVADMLGSRRTTVTVSAGDLQRRGLIEYRRGRIQILDRAGLEAAGCDCYQVTKGLYRGLYKHYATHHAPADSDGTAPAAA